MVLLLLLLVVGDVVVGEDHVALPSNLIAVPLYRQETSYSCGPSSALALLRYWDWDHYHNVSERSLYAGMNTTTNGTDPGPIAGYFNRVAHMYSMYQHGVEHVTLLSIQNAIDKGQPPIVDFQAWTNNLNNVTWRNDWQDGHFNVVVGYDEKRLFFMDPSTDHTYAYVDKKDFLERWHDVDGVHNTHTQHMLVLVQPDKQKFKPHPIKPKHNYATKEN